MSLRPTELRPSSLRSTSLHPMPSAGNDDFPTPQILRPPKIPIGPYLYNSVASATVKPPFLTGDEPQPELAALQIQSYLPSATGNPKGDFSLRLSAAVAVKQCSYWPIYNQNHHFRALFLETIKEQARSLALMIFKNTTRVEREWHARLTRSP